MKISSKLRARLSGRAGLRGLKPSAQVQSTASSPGYQASAAPVAKSAAPAHHTQTAFRASSSLKMRRMRRQAAMYWPESPDTGALWGLAMSGNQLMRTGWPRPRIPRARRRIWASQLPRLTSPVATGPQAIIGMRPAAMSSCSRPSGKTVPKGRS